MTMDQEIDQLAAGGLYKQAAAADRGSDYIASDQ